jgi:hypothetical protein
MRRVACAIVTTFAGAACATALPANSPNAEPETMTLRTPGDLSHVTFDGARLFGPQIEIARDGASYRGRSPHGLVDLRSHDDTIQGVVGSDRTELHLERFESDGFRVRGLNGGTLGELEVRSDRIVGQLGGCSYDLHHASAACGATYSGMRSCGGLPQPAELALPPSVVALEPLDRAVVLAIFLGS